MTANRIDLHKLIHNCPHFPRQGILFRALIHFRNNEALNYISDEFYCWFRKFNID